MKGIRAVTIAALLLGFADCVGGTCSRQLSRQVRRYLTDDVLPILNVKRESLPSSCPFHPLADMYLEQENHKSEHQGSDYQCQYCDKKFLDEFYMDKHMDRLHADMIPANATVCLADHCPMFGCGSAEEIAKKKTNVKSRDVEEGFGRRIMKNFGKMERCSEEEVLLIREQCAEVSDRYAFTYYRIVATLRFQITLYSHRCFDAGASARFSSIVCSNVQCVHGILKGGIKPETNKDPFVATIFRILFLVIIASVLIIQVLFSDTVYYRMVALFGWRKRGSANYLKDFQRSANYGWFLNTIIDAFRYKSKAQ
ncbi:hypothetical protein B484DRAFT_347218 [Ochromonadaceae sp. CCMP2298]|nr:hypothetical protein B484DRAFT_347218 [Ochromonadaceae sp. CCMP2298]